MAKEEQPSMIYLFVRHCLLFRTKDRLFWFFGIFVWIDIIVLTYAIVNLLKSS